MPEQVVEDVVRQDYEYGFVTDIEAESLPPGLNEDTIRFISAKKDEPEWMLEWRLKAYRKCSATALEIFEGARAQQRLVGRCTTGTLA